MILRSYGSSNDETQGKTGQDDPYAKDQPFSAANWASKPRQLQASVIKRIWLLSTFLVF